MFADHFHSTMSRWSLLKSAVSAGKRDCKSDTSIHRFNGYNLISKKKTLWKGYCLEIDHNVTTFNSHDELLLQCYNYLEVVDCCECTVNLKGHNFEQLSKMTEIVNVGYSLNLWELLDKQNIDISTFTISIRVTHKFLVPAMKTCEYNVHTVNIENLEIDTSLTLSIYTREKPKESGLTAKALLSNKLHNVDNTGNICVWPAESILLHTLLNNPKYRSTVQSSRDILELGGGLTALAGLGIAASGLCKGRVVISDGHPDCVANQRVCIAMNQQMGTISNNTTTTQTQQPDNITSCLLHWGMDACNPATTALTSSHTGLFDLIIASDCLFFRDFHDDLIKTLLNLLSVDGTVLLLQPQRDGTLDLFVSKCSVYFEVERDENYSDQLTEMRRSYLTQDTQDITNQQQLTHAAAPAREATITEGKVPTSQQSVDETQPRTAVTSKPSVASSGYNEDIHFPVMLVLTRRRNEVKF